jgi:hypothetical protein
MNPHNETAIMKFITTVSLRLSPSFSMPRQKSISVTRAPRRKTTFPIAKEAHMLDVGSKRGATLCLAAWLAASADFAEEQTKYAEKKGGLVYTAQAPVEVASRA